MGKSKKSLKKYDKIQNDIMYDLEKLNEEKWKEEELAKINAESLYVINAGFDKK